MQAQLRDQQKALSKLPISTGFTPESTMGEHASLMKKKQRQQDEIKSTLAAQMQRRQDQIAQQKREKLEHEAFVNMEAKQGLEQLKEKQKKDKELEKQLMTEELQRVQSLKL